MWPLRMLVLAAFLLMFPSPAAAARPIEGARYLDYEVQTRLKVSEDGRSLSPRSIVDAKLFQPSSCNRPAPAVRLGSRRHLVRISPGGRFRFVKRTAGLVIRVRGRFATRDRVRVGYLARPRRKRALPRGCGGGPTRLSAHRAGPIRMRNCRTHRAKTLLLTATGRVFEEFVWRPGRSGPSGNSWIDAAYGCLFFQNEPFGLGQVDDDDFDLDVLQLVGPYVAYEVQGCVGLGCGFSLVVRDLRDGGKFRDESTSPVGDLELKENGSVAWIATSNFDPAKPMRWVWASDSLGTRLLDEGPDIAPGSLALNGSMLSWVNGALSRSATLE